MGYGRTHGPTDRRTDRASYRDAWTHLKMVFENGHFWAPLAHNFWKFVFNNSLMKQILIPVFQLKKRGQVSSTLLNTVSAVLTGRLHDTDFTEKDNEAANWIKTPSLMLTSLAQTRRLTLSQLDHSCLKQFQARIKDDCHFINWRKFIVIIASSVDTNKASSSAKNVIISWRNQRKEKQ